MVDFSIGGFQPKINAPKIQPKTDKTEEKINKEQAPQALTKDIGAKALDYLNATSSFLYSIKTETQKAGTASPLDKIPDADKQRISNSMAEFEALFNKRQDQINVVLKEIPGSEKLSDNAKMYLTAACIDKVDMPDYKLPA